MGHPKRTLLFQSSIFKGYVTFREGSPRLDYSLPSGNPRNVSSWLNTLTIHQALWSGNASNQKRIASDFSFGALALHCGGQTNHEKQITIIWSSTFLPAVSEKKQLSKTSKTTQKVPFQDQKTLHPRSWHSMLPKFRIIPTIPRRLLGHLQMSLPRCQVQRRAPRRVGRRNVASTTEALHGGTVAVAGGQV